MRTGLLGSGPGGRGIQPYFSCAGLLDFGFGAGVYRLIIFIDFLGTTTENYVQAY